MCGPFLCGTANLGPVGPVLPVPPFTELAQGVLLCIPAPMSGQSQKLGAGTVLIPRAAAVIRTSAAHCPPRLWKPFLRPLHVPHVFPGHPVWLVMPLSLGNCE